MKYKIFHVGKCFRTVNVSCVCAVTKENIENSYFEYKAQVYSEGYQFRILHLNKKSAQFERKNNKLSYCRYQIWLYLF